MNIIIDITHPAHVHFFKNAYEIFLNNGHQVKIVSRDKDLTLQLLEEYGYPNKVLSKVKQGVVGLSVELIQHASRLFKIAKEFKPDVMLSIGGTFIVHVGKLLGIKTVVFYDTEYAKLSNTITYPFATWICTPSCYLHDLGEKHIRYEGYQELAYLHPNYFKPDPTVMDEIGIEKEERFVLIRFISWQSSHDLGQTGFTLEDKRRLVDELSKHARVIITSETALPFDFEPYRFSISPTKIHDLLAFAHLYIGESATMASEAALLGTPSIHVNTTPAYGYIKELEKRYGLVHRFTESKPAIDKAIAALSRDSVSEAWREQYETFLNEKIDVTAWVVEFIERISD